MSCKWIKYKNQKILFQDYKGLNREEMLSTADKAFKIQNKCNEPIKTLIDIRKAYLSKEFMEKVKQIGRLSDDKIHKAAIIGIQGVKKVLFNAFNTIIGTKHFKAFNNEDEAKEYLIP